MMKKVTFVKFSIKTRCILSVSYMYKVSCKMDKNFLRYSMFFHRGPTSLPSPTPVLRFSKRSNQIGLRRDSLSKLILFKPVLLNFSIKTIFFSELCNCTHLLKKLDTLRCEFNLSNKLCSNG